MELELEDAYIILFSDCVLCWRASGRQQFLLFSQRYFASLRHCLERVVQCIDKIVIQGKYPDGKWTRKPLAYRKSNNVTEVKCIITPSISLLVTIN